MKKILKITVMILLSPIAIFVTALALLGTFLLLATGTLNAWAHSQWNPSRRGSRNW